MAGVSSARTLRYANSQPLPNPKAEQYIPTFLYEGFPDPHGRSDVDIRNDFYGTRRKVRIGVLGAGIMGLQFLHSAEKLKDAEIVVYEMNDDVGGVVRSFSNNGEVDMIADQQGKWLTSKYPGCRCDIASAVYQFSWRTNIWSQMHAQAAENLAYIKTVASENGFYKFIRLRHQVISAAWRDEDSKWTLEVKDLSSGVEFEDAVDFFLEFHGPVSNPRLNAMPGLGDFKGEVVHPAHWKDDTNVKNKRVALIGYGCSGVQIAPSIIDDVSQLYTWFRNKTYILPPPNQAFSAEGGANFKYSNEQKELLQDPDAYLAYRKAIEDGFNKRYSYLINGGKVSKEVHTMVVEYMKDKLKNRSELFDAIVPQDFVLGCRRQTFSYGYLEAITHPKATVFLKPPKRFTEHGVLDANGNEHALDMVIAATGYDQSHMPRFPRTVNGEDIGSKHKDILSPPSYMACMTKDMPNYFNPASAFGPLPQGNFYQSCEAFTEYIVKVIDKMQLDHVLSVKPKDIAVDHFVRHSNAWMKRTALTGPCVAWFKGNDGTSKPPSLWPGDRSQFLKIMQTPRFEDFDLRYENEEDTFGFFGNGWDLETHGEEGGDRTWYMGSPGREVGQEVIEKLKGTDPSVGEDGVEVPVKT